MNDKANRHQDQETLDPRDWDEMRRLAHRIMDDALDYIRDARERPAWRAVPNEVAERLTSPAPKGPCNPEAVYEEFREVVLPYPIGNIHPRFWGWVLGAVLGIIASYALSLVAQHFNLNWQFTWPWQGIALSLLFSLICGLLFGYRPANQASHLDPVTALRAE